MTAQSNVVAVCRRAAARFSVAELESVIFDTRRIRETLETDLGIAHSCIIVAVMRAALKRKKGAEV